MKRVFALLLSLLLLTGCSSAPAGGEETGEGELETIDVMLDWYPNAVHAFLYEAEANGYFADAGLKVNILYPSNPTDPLTMAAAGKIDFGFYYQEDTIIAKANENVPVKVVGTVVHEPLETICSLKENGIETPADLKGKTIGYTGVQFAETTVNEVLSSAGLTSDDVEFVNVGFDLMSAMTTGNVDATFGCFINHEIPALEEQGFEMNVIRPVDNGVPNYYALMLVTGEEKLAERQDAYTRFLQACQKGFEDMKADPQGALSLLMDNQDKDNFPLTESVEQKSFDILLPMMDSEAAPFLSQTAEDWQQNIDWLQRTGMIETGFDPADIMADLLG